MTQVQILAVVISRFRAAFCLVYLNMLTFINKKAPQLSPIGDNRGASTSI